MLRAYVRRFVKDDSDVAEIMQELALRIVEMRDHNVEWHRSAGWCRALARSVIAHFHRARRRRSSLHELLDEDRAGSRESTPEDRVVARNLLDGALRQVDSASVRLLMRRYVLEENAQEIAEGSDCSPDSVRMRLMRLRGAATRASKG